MVPDVEAHSCEKWIDSFDLKGCKSGCRAYLTVAGGFAIPEIMESKKHISKGWNWRLYGEGTERLTMSWSLMNLRKILVIERSKVHFPSQSGLSMRRSSCQEENLYPFHRWKPI
ncbi:hypothetical protein RCO48_27195 [Peribacillus frigoritolerans]|nr:hypothetical protein [Peribacillus frigoritolerans]